jgi:multidrug efflux pump subunit AcrA (membrane-fusion protein)
MNIKNLPRWSVPLIILAIAFIMLALLIATKPAPPTTTSKEKAWQVSVQEVIFVDAKPQLELFAKSESPHSAQLKATLSAEVIALDALEGDTVEAGQTIIQLDPREASWKVQQRQADVDELKARILAENNRFDADRTSLGNEQKIYEIAKKASDRQARLRESNLVAQERYDIAASQAAQSLLAITQRKQSIADHPARLSQLKASLSRAMAFLNQAKFELEKSKIQTPFKARITALHVAPGERVQAGQLLAEVFDADHIELRAQMPNTSAHVIESALARGEEIDAHSGTRTFKLSRVSGKASASHGGLDAFFIPTDQSTTVALNESLMLQVELPEVEQVIALPRSAIYGSNRIFVVQEERLKSVLVDVVGQRFEHNSPDIVFVKTEELKAGQHIITTQLPNAINGLKVEVRGSIQDPSLVKAQAEKPDTRTKAESNE